LGSESIVLSTPSLFGRAQLTESFIMSTDADLGLQNWALKYVLCSNVSLESSRVSASINSIKNW